VCFPPLSLYRYVLTSPSPVAVPGPPLSTSLTSHGLASDYAALHAGSSSSAPTDPSAPAVDPGLPELKLGQAPINPQLDREVKRQIREGDGEDPIAPAVAPTATGSGDAGAVEAVVVTDEATGEAPLPMEVEEKDSKPALPPLLAPFPAELPPFPSTFRTIDVAREVELVREARKRIRLGAEAYEKEGVLITAANSVGGGEVGKALLKGGKGAKEEHGKGVGKPSVCLFTVHDAGDS
jgi:transcription initiation factor TFIID subunit 5